MQQRSIRAVVLSALFIVPLATFSIGARFATPAAAQIQAPSSASPADNYVLGPNDRVRLKVYGEPDITGEYEIDSTGNVSVPLAGHIKAVGLTTKQLERSITSALSKGIVRDPRVNVEIAQYRPYYILGEVITFMLWASVAVQWNVLMGHAGVFSLGQMLFFACGSYTVAMLGSYLGVSPWLSIPLGAVVAATSNIVGGFLITDRMLRMFKSSRPAAKP